MTTLITMDTIFSRGSRFQRRKLCFIERPRSFIHSSLCLERGELDGEVGDLLFCEYKFCRRGFPVSRKREEGSQLNACIRTMPANEVDVEQNTCDVSSSYCGENHTLGYCSFTCFRSRNKCQIKLNNPFSCFLVE